MMHRYLSSPPVYGTPVESIDHEAGIIRGVTIARTGPAKGHGGLLDRTFLLQIVDLASTRQAGVKARFGHPNMCSTALGTYLGRFKNYSYAGDKVTADLHLDDTARSTPNGDLFAYILDMAEKNPDMFGASIAFEPAESVFLEEDADGAKVKNEYFRIKNLLATDIVDEPAATEGLFSADTLPALATQFLDDHPEVTELIFSKPATLIEFLSNYLSTTHMNLAEKLKTNFTAFLNSVSASQAEPVTQTDPDAAEPAMPSPVVAEDQPEVITMAASELEDLVKKLEARDGELETRDREMETLHTAIADLESQLAARAAEVATLRDQLSARPTIPMNVTDPLVSLDADTQKDDTGKQVLAAIPKDLKRKLTRST